MPEFYYPLAFWDSLSTIHLTRSALDELDRRNLACTAKASPRNPQSTVPPNEYLSSCDARTRRLLDRASRQGGLDMSQLRGFPMPKIKRQTQSVSRLVSEAVADDQPEEVADDQPEEVADDQPSTTTYKTRKTGPYDRNFRQLLTDNHVYPTFYRFSDGRVPPKPSNWLDIQQRLTQPRRSLSPSEFSEIEFEIFVQAAADAMKEEQVATSVIPIIEGGTRDGRCVAGGIPFGNLAPLTNVVIVPGNPDLYYGARPEQINQQVRKDLSCQILPSTQADVPACPNFFLAVKGPGGSSAAAGYQACYDGALGARAMYSLQTYGANQPISDNNASTITSIYHAGSLTMCTIHRVDKVDPANSQSQPEYHMHQLNAFALTGNAETFRQGVTAFRNARQWAQEQRDEAIQRANKIASLVADESSGTNVSGVRHESPTGGQADLGCVEQTASIESTSDELPRRTNDDSVAKQNQNVSADHSSSSPTPNVRKRKRGEAESQDSLAVNKKQRSNGNKFRTPTTLRRSTRPAATEKWCHLN